MAKKKAGKGFLNLGLDKTLNIILAIFPGISQILGIVTRLLRGKLLGALLNLVIFPLFWIVDIITIVQKNDLILLAK